MIISKSYLIDNKETILENVSSFQMIRGAYSLMEEDEIDTLRESFLNESVDKFIAFSHVIDEIPLDEGMVHHVNSKGERGLRKSRDERAKFAFKTTGLTKMKRREIALKASKTKMSRPSSIKKANRKRNKARRKRESLGLRNNE